MVDKVKQNLKQLNQTKVDKNINIKNIENKKDIAKKNNIKNLSKKVYKYWVYIFKDGVKVKDFGVNEEEIGDVKLLIRREEVKGEQRIMFRELYPEPRFDTNTIQKNKSQIKRQLDRLKQIEKELEKNMFAAKPKEYNYDITDVRIAIEEKEIMLKSIRHGVTHRYMHDIRPDGIPALFYEQENSNLKLIKYVKEDNTLTESTENKKIESAEAKRQIDHQLKKKDAKDWQKIAIFSLWIILLCVASYATWQFMNYNKDREMQFATENLDKIFQKQTKMYDEVIKVIKESAQSNTDVENRILENSNDILKQCVVPQNQIPTSG